MLAYLLIVCVSFYIVSATLIRLVGEYLFSQKAEDELAAARGMASAALSPLGARDGEALYALLREGSSETSRALVLDPYGKNLSYCKT